MIIYYTQLGQSLSDLCNEIQLENPEYLRDYHNQNCSLSERFKGDIAQGMKIYIPSSQEIREINKKIRDNSQSFYDFPANGKFPFDFKLWEGTYQITQTTYSDNTVLAKYENKVRLNLEGIKGEYYHFLFSAFDFRKNEDISDSKVNTLAKMCIEVIYPIRYIIDTEGKLIDIVLTRKTEDIVSELDSIKNFFPDQYSSDYIEKMKGIIENPEIISRKFKNTLFNSFMFSAFFRTKLGSWRSSDIYYDFYPWIFDAQPIRFEFQNILSSKDIVDDERVKIQQKGISIDNRNLEGLHFTDSKFDEKTDTEKKPIDCEHFAEYFFNRENLSLYKVDTRFQYFGNENIKREDFLLERITDSY
ncbi:hypothetical protein BBI01_06270 [Chryseobacterium artocarpi]|uniref:LysM domain-containing protein n=1 Tax=Chryseobacterium artocarpi TaxID=1414727 RepID=A0A1B8ZXJ7_9FLAO|nr:hypothetical protein [Chryseobacterium artocarpi]OCA76295.1 hypothetical protein BBI01_06270 [Chryseobacterium artocarpi]